MRYRDNFAFWRLNFSGHVSRSRHDCDDNKATNNINKKPLSLNGIVIFVIGSLRRGGGYSLPLKQHEQEAGGEQSVNRADSGGLEDGSESGGFWTPRSPSFGVCEGRRFWTRGTVVSLIFVTDSTAIPTMPRITTLSFVRDLI